MKIRGYLFTEIKKIGSYRNGKHPGKSNFKRLVSLKVVKNYILKWIPICNIMKKLMQV